MINARAAVTTQLSYLVASLREPNPIWVHELRARWRRPLTQLIVLAYAGALSWLAWNLFDSAQRQSLYIGVGLSAPGHKLFVGATYAQMMVWAFLGPLLAAPAISIERERGRLPELLLAGLTHRQIIRGKLFSTFSFVGVLLLVPLPITAVCFQAGGVSPWEFAVSFVMQAALAIAYVTMGLACSAVSKKVTTSLGLCLFVSLVNLAFISTTYGFIDKSLLAAAVLFSFVSLCVASASESIAMTAMEPPSDWQADWDTVEATKRYLITEGALSSSAPRAPLVPYPATATTTTPHPATLPNAALMVAAPAESALVSSEVWEQLEDEDRELVDAGTQETFETDDPQQFALRLVQRWAERNPICERELRVRLRAQSSQGWDFGEDEYSRPGLLLVGIIGGVTLGLTAYFIPLQTGVSLVLLLLVTYCAAIAATAFTYEREQNMLSMLVLTSMPAREIVAGKIAVPLLLSLHVFTYPLLVLAWWAFLLGPRTGLSVLLLLGSFAFCASALGTGFSWICRHAPIAAGATIALLAALVMAPRGIQLAVRTPAGGWPGWWLDHVSSHLEAPHESWELLAASSLLSLVLILVGAVVSFGVQLALRPKALEADRKSLLHTDLSQNLH